METIREQIEAILPDVLPDKPEEAINGTQLAQKILKKIPKLNEGSIRQYFSIMHTDSNSILAKTPGKHGFYKRPISLKEELSMEGLTQTEKKKIEKEEEDASKRDEQREEKFRSIFMRYNELTTSGVYSMPIEHTRRAKGDVKGLNKWKYPDVILLNWEVGEIIGEEYGINTTMLEVRRSLGEQPFTLTSTELKSELNVSNFRESFFQCMSNSKWSHKAQLAVAVDIQEERLINELTRLGKSYDVTILTYGLTGDIIDEIPDAQNILSMKDSEFDEQISKLINVTTITTGREREILDWEHIKDLRQLNSDFDELFQWISKCLLTGVAYKFNDYRKIMAVENNYGGKKVRKQKK